MQQFHFTVVELGVVQGERGEVPGGSRFESFVRVEAHESRRFVGEVIVKPDHSRVFVVHLPSIRNVVPNTGFSSGRGAGWKCLQNRKSKQARSVRLER